MAAATPGGVMLILRGIAGHYAGRDWPKGALFEEPAIAYARRRGFEPRVLDVAGATGRNSEQVNLALQAIRQDDQVAALYGFSGGGYNIAHIIRALKPAERARLKLIVVLGAPNNPESLYRGPWDVVYRMDPTAAKGGHMGGPQALLESLGPVTPAAVQAVPTKKMGVVALIGGALAVASGFTLDHQFAVAAMIVGAAAAIVVLIAISKRRS